MLPALYHHQWASCSPERSGSECNCPSPDCEETGLHPCCSSATQHHTASLALRIAAAPAEALSHLPDCPRPEGFYIGAQFALPQFENSATRTFWSPSVQSFTSI